MVAQNICYYITKSKSFKMVFYITSELFFLVFHLLLLQGVGPQEYTLIKMKIVEPYTAKFKSKIFYSR